MEKKRGRPPKVKEGRPIKVRQVNNDEEDQLQLQSSRKNGETLTYGGASSSPGYQTRYSKALAEKEANPSQNPTLLLVKQILFHENGFGAKRPDPVSNDVPEEAPLFISESPVRADEEFRSQQENICSDRTTNVNVLDLKKFTLDLLAQTDEEPELNANNAVSNIFVDNNNNNNPEKNQFVDFDEYKVKEDMIPLLKAIFAKYGDIVKESTFSKESRNCLLELVCTIYERLKASKLMQLKPLEMESISGQIGDLEIVKVKVGWLRKRLDLIVKARELCEGASSLEEAESRVMLAVEEKLKAVESFEKKVAADVAGVENLQRRIRYGKDEVAVLDKIIDLFDGSLVDGIV
ncbi:hypothetical protein ABFS82_09G099600 [Erythranthe guttata]|uniref:Uncharacterized protein n=1 Tax=Erythranthe guttata TaxID=4155 RepID=A0A022Q4X8_ERYGU|nr:PREDICTED: uncharacterized protein LOC105976048 [Erythranthe guttata]EYU21565.1 hypothetical protein MIMGU_mgv1a009254mg [Erythranthe guttata]|eukprot:XP_012856783.1 PREDICTED: uncharacterized protein LOC105976048 [Erythranthe guttata]